MMFAGQVVHVILSKKTDCNWDLGWNGGELFLKTRVFYEFHESSRESL